MKVHISGYKNLENLELNLTENKINMIFGMSGSGKSSIAGALNNDNCDRNKTIGLSINQIINIDGNNDLPTISSFNKNIINEYVIEKKYDDVYTIFIDSNNDVKKAEKSLFQLIDRAIQAIVLSENKYNTYTQLKKEIGSELNKDNSLRKTAKIVALENSFKKINSSSIIKHILNLPPQKLEWLKNGMTYTNLEDKICPFCEKKLSIKQLNKINKITNFESKSLESINKVQRMDNNILGKMSLTLKGIEQTKKDLIDIIVALKQFDKIKQTIDELKNLEYKNWNTPFKLGKELKTYFPEVYNISNKTFKNMTKVKELMNNAHNNTKKVLSRRLTKINRYLKQMSIPYEIQVEYANKKIKSYKIVHIKDNLVEDRSDALSEGETCIIALILFIFKCKSNNSKLIIIDDPASSYDDFRRSQILKIIQKELDGRTVLLLSHDNVFAKYAVADKYKHTDKIYYFENYGKDVILTEIKDDDFGDFNDFVFNRLKDMTDYYQKIINLRMLYEGQHHSYAYGYLSAILHKKTVQEINEELKKRNTTEDRVIELIKDKYKDLKDLDLPNYSEQTEIDLSKYSILEKAIWARDNAISELEKDDLIDELNEFAHINSCLKICLNPYKFTFCTKRLYDFLNNIK